MVRKPAALAEKPDSAVVSLGSQQSVTPVPHDLMIASSGTCTRVFHIQITDEHINKTNTLLC